MNLNPPKQVAGLTVLALSHLPSGLDLLTFPVGQHELTFRGPSEFSMFVNSCATWMEKYSPEAEGVCKYLLCSYIAGFPLVNEFSSHYQGSKVTSG